MDIYITRGCFRSKREMGWSGDINRAALMREVEAFIQQQGFTEYVPLTNYVIPTPLPFYKSAAELRANQVRGLLLTREMEERRREHYEKKEVRKARDKARAQAKREHKKNFVGPLQPWQLAKPNKVNYPPDATKGEIFVINMGLVGRALRRGRRRSRQREKRPPEATNREAGKRPHQQPMACLSCGQVRSVALTPIVKPWDCQTSPWGCKLGA